MSLDKLIFKLPHKRSAEVCSVFLGFSDVCHFFIDRAEANKQARSLPSVIGDLHKSADARLRMRKLRRCDNISGHIRHSDFEES